jgi:hypothetical protein
MKNKPNMILNPPKNMQAIEKALRQAKDPRHEIAMAIHHISMAKDELERGDPKTELEAAIRWLEKAQKKAN